MKNNVVEGNDSHLSKQTDPLYIVFWGIAHLPHEIHECSEGEPFKIKLKGV